MAETIATREAAVAGYARDAAARHGIAAALLMAVVSVESDFSPTATNMTGGDLARGGSYGLAQMSLATARALGFKGEASALLSPAVNLDLAARYLRDLTREAAAGGYGLDSAVSSYNGGNSAHRRGDGKRVGTIAQATPAEAKKVPFINQLYVDTVLSRVKRYAALGFSMDAPAYLARGGSPDVMWAALGLMFVAVVR